VAQRRYNPGAPIAPTNEELPGAPDMNFGYTPYLPGAPDPYLGAQPNDAPDWTGTYAPQLSGAPDPLTSSYTPDLPHGTDPLTSSFQMQLPDAPIMNQRIETEPVQPPEGVEASAPQRAPAPEMPDVMPPMPFMGHGSVEAELPPAREWPLRLGGGRSVAQTYWMD